MAPPSSLPPRPQQRQKRKWTRTQLLRHLEIFADFSDDILPNLPSQQEPRAHSPAPGAKRKADPTITQEHAKRPRTDSQANRPANLASLPASSSSSSSRTPRPPTAPANGATRLEPSEEGEVREDLPGPPPPPSATAPPVPPAPADGVADVVMSTVPVRRPKQGRRALRQFDYIHDRYYAAGRKLKYSGDARFWSTYLPTNREYRALPNPPSPNSSYHKHGGLIARLELVEALICFTYALWNKDYGRRCCIVESWTTTTAFLAWCKTKWQAQEASTDGEKALLGLIFMIEGFIHARKVAYSHRSLDVELVKLIDAGRTEVNAKIAVAEQQLANPSLTKKQGTPQMLPSPANSIAASNSANSTPTNRDGDTPNPEAVSAPSAAPAPSVPQPHARFVAQKYTKVTPPHVAAAVNSTTLPISANAVGNLKDHMSGMSLTMAAFNAAQQTLTLPIMQRHFPKTFARMVYSTLSPTDEHEPDFEDDEGELFWPGQSTSGEGLGWVCLMGQAMLREFGRGYGYKGLAGVVPKPPPETAESASRSGAPGASGSTPHGSTPSVSR